MKKRKYISALSLATLLLGMASCTSDDVQDMTEKTASLELRTDIAPTRAIIEGTQFTEGDSIDLVMQGTANNVSSCRARLEKGQWVLDREVLLNKNRVGICGITVKSDLKNTSLYDWNGSIVPTETGNQTDILVGTQILDKYAVNSNNPYAYLQFRHLLARVSFDIKQVGGNGHLTRLSLVNIEKGTAIGTRLETGYVTEYANSGISQLASCGLLAGQDYTSAEADKQAAYDAAVMAELQSRMNQYAFNMRVGSDPLVMPTDLKLSEEIATVDLLAIPTVIDTKNRVGLQLVIDGKTYQVEIPAATWNGNYRYRYPVTIDLTSDKLAPLTIGSATIDAWGGAKALPGVEQTVNMD